MFLRMVDLTAVKRHWPQHTCPHGVKVALVGGEKQMGHVYVERGSGVGLVEVAMALELEGAPEKTWSAFGDTITGSSESERLMGVERLDNIATGWSEGGGLGGALGDASPVG